MKFTLVLRIPKATLNILRAYGEDPFRAIFGLELDCGKLWRRESLGAGVNQPEHPWEVRERLLHRLVRTLPDKRLRATLLASCEYGTCAMYGSRIRPLAGRLPAAAHQDEAQRSAPERLQLGASEEGPKARSRSTMLSLCSARDRSWIEGDLMSGKGAAGWSETFKDTSA